MSYDILRWIVDQESGTFQRIENRWRPTDLYMETQIRALLKDMSRRYERLVAARDELSMLDRKDMYLKLIRRMGFFLKNASFSRRSNHLAFAQATTGFYTDFGAVIRFLKFDQARGRLNEPEETV